MDSMHNTHSLSIHSNPSRYGLEYGQQKQHRPIKNNTLLGPPRDVHHSAALNGRTEERRRPYSADFYNGKAGPPQQRMLRSHDSIVMSRPLTKQVDQLHYELPQQNKFSINALCQPPEFLKVFSDMRCKEGDRAVFDCVLLGSPRPKVYWLFNDEKMKFDDIFLEDTADTCRCTIKYVQSYHYGIYTILAENEVGRAITTATLLPSYTVYNEF